MGRCPCRPVCLGDQPTSCPLQRKILATLRTTWEAELRSQLQATKARLAQVTRHGRPTLYPFLCVLPEDELVQMLLQVAPCSPAGAGRGRGSC